MKKIKAIKMATGGLMSQPPYIAKQDKSLIEAYDVNTPASARKGLPSRAMSSSRTRMKDGGLLVPRLKFKTGDTIKDKIEARKFEKLEAMKDSGLELTPKQEQELESYKAKDRKVEMALGGEVVEKYSTQRPDYQAYAEGGEVEDDMDMEDEMPMEDEVDMEDDMDMEDDTSLLEPIGMEDEMPMDEEMEEEEDYGDMDAIIDTSALSEEEEKILDESIDMHPELEAIIPKLVATEFTEDGEVEGPGTGTSDSIPALLSDGEFVFTAKAVKNIGVDKLRKMMKQAEESYDAGNSAQAEEV